MKTLFLTLVTILLSFKLQAQSTVTTSTLSVKGNCEDCKERIENAADIKGVKVCKWDSETKVATITFDTSKTTMETIEKAIAKAGYETATQKADPKAYAKLPKCCKYNDGVCEEKK